MKPKSATLQTVDDYIATFPRGVRANLRKIRATIRKAAPNAEERISYRMPGYFQRGVLIYFAGHEQHIGLYPAPRGVPQFAAELSAYEGGKGTIRLPLDRPIPLDLIRRIVKFRVAENLAKAAAKSKKAAKTKPAAKRPAPAKRAEPAKRRSTSKPTRKS
ncbi:MAG: DUF1801 domain-containing protein [Pirellulales bacterium]|nr:DUF1801 domain-containing protein [Pirellulales bacterium]